MGFNSGFKGLIPILYWYRCNILKLSNNIFRKEETSRHRSVKSGSFCCPN